MEAIASRSEQFGTALEGVKAVLLKCSVFIVSALKQKGFRSVRIDTTDHSEGVSYDIPEGVGGAGTRPELQVRLLRGDRNIRNIGLSDAQSTTIEDHRGVSSSRGSGPSGRLKNKRTVVDEEEQRQEEERLEEETRRRKQDPHSYLGEKGSGAGDTSARAIKEAFGVDAEALRAGREHAEEEEHQSDPDELYAGLGVC